MLRTCRDHLHPGLSLTSSSAFWPPDPPYAATEAFLALVESHRSRDWPALFLGCQVGRWLRMIRDQVRLGGRPRTFEDKLRLTLIPYIPYAAPRAGADWTVEGLVAGILGPLFEIDARLW